MATEFDMDIKKLYGLYKYPEKYRVLPFRIFGNLYYVGNADVGAHLIDSGDGLILIDTTYPSTAALLIQSIWELGFRPEDIRIILHTHGHFDHFGGTALIKALSGARTFLGEADARMFCEQPQLALCADCRGYAYTEPFVPDVEIRDGDIISLGNTEIKAVATPGHTDGVMSFFFDVTDGTNVLRAGLFGGAGVNTMTSDFNARYHNSQCRRQFPESLEKIRNEKVDITLGNHAAQNHTLEKYEKMKSQKDGDNPFIDSGEWQEFIRSAGANFQRMLLAEQRK
ncbi:MBL fold metallo-hydrolase [Enterocloster hominis (ex Hitch et al. 2024)]|uniref:MBL fold metallo-hydrolase n=1 Tax=Enterocloster hominis (ex Hitch et al. 2024) TaxID=1917870 RepID=A0ABV1DC02_9FIRM